MTRSRTAPQEHETSAERVVLGMSLGLVLLLLALILWPVGEDSGPRPAVIAIAPALAEVRREGGQHYLPVDVTNTGEQAVASVTVDVTLTVPDGGEPETASFTIEVLAQGATVRGVVIFRADPASGALDSTASYLEP